MNIYRENLDALNAEVKIKLDENDYHEKVNKVLHDYQRKMRMNGFRPGKVPMGLIKKMHGKSVLVDEINKILSKSLHDYLSENKIEILGSPLPKEEDAAKIDWDNQKNFEFTYEMGLSPRVDLKLANEKINRYKVINDNTLTNKYEEYLRKRFGKYEDTETSKEEDVVYGEFIEIDETGAVKEGAIAGKDAAIVPNTLENEMEKKRFTGIKKGDSFKINPKNISGKPALIASILGIEKNDAEKLTADLQFTVSKISRLKPADLTREFFDLVYGKETVKSEEEFRNKLSTDTSAIIKAESEKKFTNDVIEKTLEKTKLPLPDKFLKKWLIKSSEKPVTPEEINAEYDKFSKSTRWHLIKNQIVRDKEFHVTDNDAINEAKNFVKKQYAQYGHFNADDKELEETAKKIIENKEEKRTIVDNLIEEKVLEYLKSIVKIKEEEISYDEFVKLTNSEDKKPESAFSRFFKSGFKKKN